MNKQELRQFKKRRNISFLLGALVGIFAAVLYFLWLNAVPPIPTLSFLSGVKPIAQGIDPSSGHQVTVWEVPGKLDEIKDEAAKELPLSLGWQPPALRQTNPLRWQIVRVVTPKGDFQFTRWVFLTDEPGKVRVELSVGPLGNRVYKGTDLPQDEKPN